MNSDLLSTVETDVQQALNEDIQPVDVTGQLIPANQKSKAVVITRETMTMAGQAWFEQSIVSCDANAAVTWFFEDGNNVLAGSTLCEITANSRALLAAERTALNFLQMLSGVATKTAEYVKYLEPETALLDTRKTIPKLRAAQKYAVVCAGGQNHRFGLYDAFLIKENHIKACGTITKAVDQARQMHPELLLEVEVEDLEQLKEALALEVDRIMLDNFTIEMIQQAITIRGLNKSKFEVSGNIDISKLAKLTNLGVEYISVGAITKSVKAIDLSMLIKEVWSE